MRGGKWASKEHDLIKEFNAIEGVRDRPVAHPQDAWSTPLCACGLTACLQRVGWLSAL